MSLYLYGIIFDTPKSSDFGPIGFNGTLVQALTQGSISALVCHSPREDFVNIPKNELVKLLLSHQRTLEIMMAQHHFVLPFKFGTILHHAEEVKKLLSQEESFLVNLGCQMKDFAEIDLIATWDVKQTLQEIAAQDTQIIEAKKELAEGKSDLASIGMLLAKNLKRKACEHKETMIHRLKDHAKDYLEHPLFNDEMVLNCSFLVEKKLQETFYGEIEKINSFYEEKLHFRCVGPLPPYSFATVTIKRFDPDQITEAAKVLQLDGKAELGKVKRIYKELSRGCHPDKNPEGDQEDFERLNEAYALIADYCKDGPQSLAKEVIQYSMRLDLSRFSSEVSHAA